MSIRHLDRLLDPHSVAVIGASDREASVGATVWRHLHGGRFKGPVWPVNRRAGMLDGGPVYASVAELPQAPDLAVICTPAPGVAGLVAELAARGTRAAVVMTAGLDAHDKQAMLDAARPSLLRVLGPNCLGLITPHLGLNASFAHADALPGDLAFVSQSGALVTAMLDWANARGIGFSRLVSLGEHADVDFGDLLDWLGSDPYTRAILLYIESIDQARKFMSAARAAARHKPVIVVKAGRAGNGVQAAASHTGAMAGSDIVFDAAIRRAGMLRVDTLGELFTAAETLARFRANRSESLVVVTNGGGAGVLAADAAAREEVPLAPLPPALAAELDRVLPANWSHGNPVDIIGDAPCPRYVAALEALLAHAPGSAILFAHAPTAIVPSQAIAEALLPVVSSHAERVMACWLGGQAVAQARERFERAGIADYATPEEAVHAFAMLLAYRHHQRLLIEAPAASHGRAPDRAMARALVAQAIERGGGWLDADAARAVLQAYGIPVVATRAVGTELDALVREAQALGWPVALKIRSPDITHKSDVGGVALDIADAAQLRAAAEAMLARVRTTRPDARVDGFSLQSMARRPQAQELIVGASIDAAFGPVLLFGAGGTAVEVLADRAIALPPLNAPLARDLIGRTRIARRLAGYRDHPAANLEAVADVLIAVSQLMADLPELAELDINPLLADDAGVLALDARLRVDAAAPGGAAHFAIQPYPDQLEERLAWRDIDLLLRPVRPDDARRHADFLAQLTPEDLRLRFFQARQQFSEGEIARLTQIDYAREMAFVAVHADESQTLGVARAVADPDNEEAEFAIVVRSDLQGLGLGRLLLDKLVRYSREHGTARLVGWVLRENRAMLALAQSLGFVVDEAGSDPDALRVVKEPI
ncbi:GNAT family N-acetyltransferase [Caldimonas sp. KR1-144]|uniref:bifunctional acetate--CoA ligase family protein/GNAT family N-acetyltransferase n=1 Tax=Caldimonas sp. KR1-144 TaxID=3400911 RepID=UPI003C04CDE1